MIQVSGQTAIENQRAAGPSPQTDWDPEVIAFCCNYCAFSAAALAGAKRMQYPAGVRIISIPCTGKLEMEHILEAFEKGADGVLVVGCLEGGCHYVEGNLRAKKRTDRIREVLDEIGLGSGRLKMVNLSDSMASLFVQQIQDIMGTIRVLGPNPLGQTEKKESAGRI
ncbi:MAG TPA: hydrogenase iron-sulfur subunit [Acidobacteriota bacterium]|nr:hydrogenase iron-sulfur subunit [Acidobacteriota bacterium]